MSLTGKSPSETYKDITYVDNNNNGVTTTLKQVKSGNGSSTALQISDRSLQVKSATNNTTALDVQNASGTTKFLVDTTNNFVKANNVLIVGTYDSFSAEGGPGPIIETEFEKTCNCDVQYVSTSQAGTLANEIFIKDKDVILGVEMHEFDFSNKIWNIYDYGFFSFIYNEETLKKTPQTFEDLVNQKDLKVIVQDPRTSPVGLGLLRWLKLTHPNDFPEILKKFNSKVLTYTPGWSEAYGMFLDEKADLVLSYSTSPFYHQEY